MDHPHTTGSPFASYKPYVTRELREMIRKLHTSSRDPDALIMAAAKLAEAVSMAYLLKLGEAHQSPPPPVSQAARISAIRSLGHFGQDLKFTSPDALFDLVHIRNKIEAHPTQEASPSLETAIHYWSIAFTFLSESKVLDEESMKSALDSALVRSFDDKDVSEAHLSTGAALEEIASRLVSRIREGSIQSVPQLVEESEIFAGLLRGHMIGFHHFFKMGTGYPLSQWQGNQSEIIAQYIDEYRSYINRCNHRIGDGLVEYLGTDKTYVCITEFSRAIFSGLQKRALISPPLHILFVARGERAEVPAEIEGAKKRLQEMGYIRPEVITTQEWLAFLGRVRAGTEHPHTILFGAEGVAHDGTVVFPQLLPSREITLLQEIAGDRSCGAEVVCVAEEYKFLPEFAWREAEAITELGRYCLIPSRAWNRIVTDAAVLSPSEGRTFQTDKSRYRALEASREILNSLSMSQYLLPLEQMSDDQLRRIKVLVADIDDTITTHGKIEPDVLKAFERLRQVDVRVMLVTGRSAGWAQALCGYLPALDCVIAENGLVMVTPDTQLTVLAREHLKGFDRAALDQCARSVMAFGQLQPTSDDPFRLYERTFIRRPDIRKEELARYAEVAARDGFEVIASSVHIHVRPFGWDKADGVKTAISTLFGPSIDLNSEVLVVGDSANDRPMLREFHQLSVGVANVRAWIDELGDDAPRFIASHAESKGFIEVVKRVVDSRGATI